jgi:cation/acetate symporter
VAVAAILGTLAGLTIAAASSLARDLYATITGRRGGALVEHVEHREVLVARLAAPGIGLLAVALALGLRHSNAALLAGLAFAVAASANVPALVLALFWARFNTTGAVAGILTGLGSCLLLVLAGPMVVGPDGFLLASIRPLFPLQNPAILSVPLGFVGAWLGTIVASRQLTALAAARRGDLVAAGSFRSMRFSALTGLRLARPNGRGQG